MTELAIVIEGKLERILREGQPCVGADGVKHPASIWTLWSAEELEAKLGAVPVTAQAVPEGFAKAGESRYALDPDGTVRESFDAAPLPVPPPPLADSAATTVAALRADLNLVIAALRAFGVPAPRAPESGS